MQLQELLATIKDRTATTESPAKFLGRTIHDKLQNFLKQGEKYLIKNAHFPEGSPEKVALLKQTFEQQFGFELPAALVSFYEIFDGFELHTQDLSPATLRTLLEEQDWILSDYKITIDFADLSVEEWRTGKNRGPLEEIKYLVGIQNEMDFEQVGGSLTYPKEKGLAYFGDITHELPKEGSSTTVIPPADRLFSKENKAGEVDGIALYYFDVFSHFYQIVLGVQGQQVALYQAQYGYGDLQKIKEDLPTYFKKILVRGLN